MPETIGQKLKQAREAKGLTIQNVVQVTHIRAPHLEALEDNDYDRLPSPVQARAFLRLYSEYLGIPLAAAISPQQDSIEARIGIGLTRSAPAPEPDAAGEGFHTASPLARFGFAHRSSPPNDPAKRDLDIHTVDGKSEALDESDQDSSPTNSSVEDEVGQSIASNEPGEQPTGQPARSRLILNSIGSTLLRRRESLSLTLEEIERHTHVRKFYLQALEAGEFDRLPSSVQARGILNNYARFLDLDVDTLLLQFADSLQIQREERLVSREKADRKNGKSPSFKSVLPGSLVERLRRYMSLDILFGGGLILLLLIFAVWGTSRVINTRFVSGSQVTAPSISVILRSSPEASRAAASATTTGVGINLGLPDSGETPVIPLPAVGQGAVQVVVIAEQQAWVRVTVDGKISFEGRVNPGTAYPYDGNIQIEVLTGNAIAVSILYNQSNLGPMGNLGEVVDRIYTSKAILVPTSTSTATPTITRTPTVTARPSITIRPSLTPRRSPTPTP